MSKLYGLIFALIGLVTLPVDGAELRVAVASNFKSTAQKLADKFEANTAHKITLISGSTGAIYSLISHGAPYDIFLSADQKRPQLLVKNDLAYPDSLFTYALGQLTFWAPKAKKLALHTIKSTIALQTGKLAIANPKLAPYGLSSWQYIEKARLKSVIKGKLIKGNNISQALQFIASGNASSGFVSYSELLHAGIKNNFVLLPPNSYQPIIQQGVILRTTKHLEAARDFVNYMQNEGCELILSSGYALSNTTIKTTKEH